MRCTTLITTLLAAAAIAPALAAPANFWPREADDALVARNREPHNPGGPPAPPPLGPPHPHRPPRPNGPRPQRPRPREVDMEELLRRAITELYELD